MALIPLSSALPLCQLVDGGGFRGGGSGGGGGATGLLNQFLARQLSW